MCCAVALLGAALAVVLLRSRQQLRERDEALQRLSRGKLEQEADRDEQLQFQSSSGMSLYAPGAAG